MQQDLWRVRARARHQNRKIRPRRVTPRGFPVPVATLTRVRPRVHVPRDISPSFARPPLCATSAYPSEKSHQRSRARAADPPDRGRAKPRGHLQEDDWRARRQSRPAPRKTWISHPVDAKRIAATSSPASTTSSRETTPSSSPTHTRTPAHPRTTARKSANVESESSPRFPTFDPSPSRRNQPREGFVGDASRGRSFAPKRRERVLARLVVGVVESADPVEASPGRLSAASIVSIVSIVSIASVAFDVSDASPLASPRRV